jgi:HTH-type transcriptional regulator/antitoxin HipB
MQQLGARFRAVRIRRGLRQGDVAERAGIHRSSVSRIERGRLDGVAIGTLLTVARILDVQVSITARSRGADLDRLVHAKHAGLHESVARWFEASMREWVLAPEVTYSIFGERGVIDLLAWHPATRAIVVIELKTDVVEVEDLIGQMSRRARLARAIAAERGWDAASVSVWVVVAESRTNRRRLAAHRSVLRNAFPSDGRAMRAWLHAPTGTMAALSMWDGTVPGVRVGGLAARHRVRRGAPRRGSADEG